MRYCLCRQLQSKGSARDSNSNGEHMAAAKTASGELAAICACHKAFAASIFSRFFPEYVHYVVYTLEFTLAHSKVTRPRDGAASVWGRTSSLCFWRAVVSDAISSDWMYHTLIHPLDVLFRQVTNHLRAQHALCSTMYI